jgi:ribosomal protein L24E
MKLSKPCYPVVAHDKKTLLLCDGCVKKHKQSTVAFYELCSKTGKQVEVWRGIPRGWLVTLGSDGTLFTVCSKKCAKDFSSRTLNKEFKPGISK